MVEIVLHGGAIALIDSEDLQSIAQHKWYLSKAGYAVRTVHVSGNKKIGVVQRGESMHRVIMGAIKGQQVDHINGDRLDNRKANLRLCGHTQNTWNSRRNASKSGFIGVHQESANVWVAKLGSKIVGYYRTAVDAAQARDLCALGERGEFAVTNFPLEQLPRHVEALPPRNTGTRTSSVVGISFAKGRKAACKWRAVYKKRHLGWFASEAEAILFLQKVKNES